MSTLKRRRIEAIQSIDTDDMMRISNIIMRLNLLQYNHIIFDWIDSQYNNNMEDIQSIFNKYCCNDQSFTNWSCGQDYIKLNSELFKFMNIDYNQELDALKIYHKQYNHILATYFKNEETNDKQLKIQSSVYVICIFL